MPFAKCKYCEKPYLIDRSKLTSLANSTSRTYSQPKSGSNSVVPSLALRAMSIRLSVTVKLPSLATEDIGLLLTSHGILAFSGWKVSLRNTSRTLMQVLL